MVLLQKTVERVSRLAVVQLYNPTDHSPWSDRDRVSMRSLVVVEEKRMIFIQNFSSLHSHNFWNTISWKCSLKDNCIRSCLIECHPLFDRKINIDPEYCVLMFLPCAVHVSRSTWYREVNMFRIFMIFVSWINRQEEHCLSSAQILTSKYQSIVDNRVKIERTSNVVDVMECPTLNDNIVL